MIKHLICNFKSQQKPNCASPHEGVAGLCVCVRACVWACLHGWLESKPLCQSYIPYSHHALLLTNLSQTLSVFIYLDLD